LASTNAPEPAAAARPAGWSQRQWLAWAGLPALLAALAAVVLLAQGPAGPLFLQLNAASATALPAPVWSFLTLLGDTTIVFSILSPLLLWRPRALMACVAAVPAGGLASVALKRAFDLPRPAGVLDPVQFHVIGPVLTNHSFPSGHTITAFAVAGALLATLAPGLNTARERWAAAIVLTVAAAVGWSRIAVGAHWPLDVVGGALTGWMAGLSGAALVRRWGPQGGTPAQAMAGGRRPIYVLSALLAVLGSWLALSQPAYPQGVAAVWLAGLCSSLTVLWLARTAWLGRQGRRP
jgi:membrane-associated phospholipid phosphatase